VLVPEDHLEQLLRPSPEETESPEL